MSLDGLIADTAWQVAKEGHAVKLFIESASEREIADGFVPKTDDWEREVTWADVVVFDDVLGQGAKAAQLRAVGKLVVGGTPYTDRLGDDSLARPLYRISGGLGKKRRLHGDHPCVYTVSHSGPQVHPALRCQLLMIGAAVRTARTSQRKASAPVRNAY